MPHAGSALINGEFGRALDIADRGLQYGDGVFTTLTVVRSAPLFLREHLARLRRDADHLGLTGPDDATLAREVEKLVAGTSEAVVKIVLTRGSGGRGYRVPQSAPCTRIVSLHPYPALPPDAAREGVAVRLCALRLAVQPRLAGVKHLNRLEQVLARAEWDHEHIREGLLQDAEGHVVEGVMSNLFLVKGGVLRTPLLDRCGVSGVMRGVVMRLAAEMDLSLAETRISLDEVYDADELFLTNSVIGIWPVNRFEQLAYSVGPLTRLLFERLQARIEGK